MEEKPGTYALVLRSQTTDSIAVGRWGRLAVRPGYYIYVGSAFGPGGLSARVSRHCRGSESKRWHIDYLRAVTGPVSVCYSQDPVQREHDWAQALARMPELAPIGGFGCSDCKCAAHLFFTAQKSALSGLAARLPGSVRSEPVEPLG